MLKHIQFCADFVTTPDFKIMTRNGYSPMEKIYFHFTYLFGLDGQLLQIHI